MRNAEAWVLGENNIIITRPTNCSSLWLLSIIPEVVNGYVIKASTNKPGIGNNHQEKLDVLCRICCAILTGYSYDVKEFVDEISNTFRSDFKNDVEGVHPGIFCPKCHAAVKHFTCRGSLSSITPFSWQPHNEQFCQACGIYSVKAKGGRPKKRQQNGRPKTITSVQDVMSLDDKNPIPPHVEKMMSHLLAMKVKHSTLANNTI